jgi:hypothetical protein
MSSSTSSTRDKLFGDLVEQVFRSDQPSDIVKIHRVFGNVLIQALKNEEIEVSRLYIILNLIEFFRCKLYFEQLDATVQHR